MKILAISLLLLIHDGMNDGWYEGLKIPGSDAICCNKHDCKNVDARIRSDGHWEVYIGSKDFPDNPYELADGHAPNDWVIVPDGTILRGIPNPTGQAVVCWYLRVVRCFAPPAEVLRFPIPPVVLAGA